MCFAFQLKGKDIFELFIKSFSISQKKAEQKLDIFQLYITMHHLGVLY